MASVFLSYDRDDATKARSIATALEKAGHRVWWDRHIKGGAQYSKEIEQALKAADAVIVLWSERSVESAWVRDEAAAGRDSGRLVPVSLDRTEPPLGFRQYQTIDFSLWKGRGRPTQVQTLAEAIDALGVGTTAATATRPMARPASADHDPARRWPKPWLILAVFLILIGLLIARPWEVKAPVPVVAVVAANSSQASSELAQELLTQLDSLQSATTGAMELVEQGNERTADLTFKVASTDEGGRPAASLSLIGRSGGLLWSSEFELGSGAPADLRQRMAFTAGRILVCALEGREPGKKPLRAATLRLYLKGCSQYAEAGNESRRPVLSIFEQVVKDAPEFKAGWAKLLRAESDLVEEQESVAAEHRKTLQRHIDEARRLDPDMPEAILAQVTLLPGNAYGQTLRLLDAANASDPENATVLASRAQALSRVGRMGDAIRDAREAAALDPISPLVVRDLVLTLAHSGRIDAARTELRRAERLWSGTESLGELQYAFNLRYGDPKDLLGTDAYNESPPGWQMYLRTKADPTPANIDRLMVFLGELYDRRGIRSVDIAGHAQAYGEFHREDALYRLIARLPPGEDYSQLAQVLFRPSLSKFRHDPRFMTVAKQIGLVDYWTKSGKWPDFCFNPGQPYDCKVEATKLAA